MPAQALFGISVAFGFIAWGIVAVQYVWPYLRAQSRLDALRPLLLLHSFRFVGLAFLVKGVVAPELPAAFAVPAAYGDLIAAVLALLALAALHSAVGIPLVWIFNLPLGQCRSSLRLLSRQCFRVSAGYVASHVLHSDFHRPAASHHARDCVLDFAPARYCRRRMKAKIDLVMRGCSGPLCEADIHAIGRNSCVGA